MKLEEKRKELNRLRKQYKSLGEKIRSLHAEILREEEGIDFELSYDDLMRYIKQKKHKERVDRKLADKMEKSREFEKALRKNATVSEKKFVAKLRFAKIEHVFQKTFMDVDNWYIVDFFLPIYGLCIELDGGYHLSSAQKVKDRLKTKFLWRNGYKVLRLKNEQADSISADDIKGYIEKYVNDSYKMDKRSKLSRKRNK